MTAAVITVNDLQDCYEEATKKNGIIDLLERFRDASSVIKTDELARCFTSSQWIERPAGGHRTITHRVTKIVIGYQTHVPELNPPIKKQLLNAVQEHMDILCLKIFKFPPNYKWKNLPDYDRALRNYNSMA